MIQATVGGTPTLQPDQQMQLDSLQQALELAKPQPLWPNWKETVEKHRKPLVISSDIDGIASKKPLKREHDLPIPKACAPSETAAEVRARAKQIAKLQSKIAAAKKKRLQAHLLQDAQMPQAPTDSILDMPQMPSAALPRPPTASQNVKTYAGVIANKIGNQGELQTDRIVVQQADARRSPPAMAQVSELSKQPTFTHASSHVAPMMPSRMIKLTTKTAILGYRTVIQQPPDSIRIPSKTANDTEKHAVPCHQPPAVLAAVASRVRMPAPASLTLPCLSDQPSQSLTTRGSLAHLGW